MATRGCYADWYDGLAAPPLPEVYRALFTPLDATANLITPAALLTTVATGLDAKLAFVILGADSKVHVIHRIQRYVPPLGRPRAPYDNVNLATFGDVSVLGPVTIEVPAPFFSRTILLPNVRTSADTSRLATTYPEADQLADDIPLGEVGDVRTRKATLLPPHLVGGVLRATTEDGGLTPRALWVRFVAPLLEDENLGPVCTPFIDWAKVAYTKGVEQANPVMCTPTPPPRHLEPALLDFRFRLLDTDLPLARVQHPEGIGGDGNLLVAALGEFRRDFADREESKLARAAVKRAADSRPSARWFSNTIRLLRLCQVGDEAELPALWQAMATNGAKVDIRTIQHHLDLDIPLLTELSPPNTSSICSPELAKAIGRLAFQSTANDIESGVHIFAMCYPTQASQFKANEVAGLYDEKVQSITGLTVEETVALKAAQTFLLPVGLVELQLVCCCYHRFLAVLLGELHPCVTAMGRFIQGLKDDVPSLNPFFVDSVPRTAGILRYIQLKMFSWIKRQLLVDEHLAPPNFVEVFEHIEQQTWTIPTLPDQYAPTVGLGQRSTTVTVAAPQAARVVAPPAHLDATIRNTSFNPSTFITKHGTPPLNDKGVVMCLSYHVRGYCKLDCERGVGSKSDHRRHTAAEAAKLVKYLAKPE